MRSRSALIVALAVLAAMFTTVVASASVDPGSEPPRVVVQGQSLADALDGAIAKYHFDLAVWVEGQRKAAEEEAARVAAEQAAAEEAAAREAAEEAAQQPQADPAPQSAPPVMTSYSGDCSGMGDPANNACWDRLAQCESGGNWAINTGNGYYGGLQFALGSWTGVGGTGRPDQASRETQIEMGRRLHASGGWGHWPACTAGFGWR